MNRDELSCGERAFSTADDIKRECQVYLFTRRWDYSLFASSLVKLLRLENNAHFNRWILRVKCNEEKVGVGLLVPGEIFEFEAIPIDGRIQIASSRSAPRTVDDVNLLEIASVKISPRSLMELVRRNSFNGTPTPLLAVGAKCQSCIYELANAIAPDCHLP